MKKLKIVLPPPPSPRMDTSQRIKHVFGCKGSTVHVTPGFALLRAGNIKQCPRCDAEVTDITDSPLGQSYIAFARLDLGAKL